MSSPMRRVEEVKDFKMNKILGSLNSMPKQGVSWKGHTWNIIKDNLNSFIKSIRTRHWISGKQYRNDKLSETLKLLSATVITKLKGTMQESNLEIQLNSSDQEIDGYSLHQANYLLALAVKTHAMKINEILEKIDTPRFNAKNASYLNRIKATVRGLNNSCQIGLEAETDFINKAQEKKLKDFNREEEMKILPDKLHEELKALQEALGKYINPLSSEEEDRSSRMARDSLGLAIASIDTGIEAEELKKESKRAIKLTEGFLKEASISSEEIKTILGKLKATHERYANSLKKD
ncbi:hypothetical protein DB41_KU00050 [Neochlamydia sp. TUME1]|uniref:hypothetical protein n=1 Tax=Neochlamydia sp. TUME1 TaxID=1478174 RepID=UPI00057D8682|nr:hypothetical protein [Neochlamydia sp. TUME1]KIC72109.1 hypothetical protein DB41_KU00050 [Neochlamydia sp. TUME1]